MKKLKAFISLVLLSFLVWALNKSWGSLPPLGKLLSPATGWANNLVNVDEPFLSDNDWGGLKEKVNIWVDDKWVPHVQAGNNSDIYFAQGYIHAYHRLWQMDLQTRAAAGRVSEVIGKKALNFDRAQRRKGMVYGAENALSLITKSEETKSMLDAYTAGVNEYIASLDKKNYPIEYKLMDFAPEPWTNLKTALMLKNMADDLTGSVDDYGLTAARQILPDSLMNMIFPVEDTNSLTVIPDEALKNFSVKNHHPTFPDSLIANINFNEPSSETSENGKGSNNWIIQGSKTKNGAPILANDPHLSLNLPSLWFEMQLQTPDMNVYGVSLPGMPGIVIGFNDSIAWGLTNNYRDVKDFYKITSLNSDRYQWELNSKKFDIKTETIKIKGAPDFIDTVKYCVYGPVMYDKDFPDPVHSGEDIAVTWMAHRPSNEFMTLYLLNRAQNYLQFQEAISYFSCPAQNVGYADRLGNIAMWCPGTFPDKQKNEGRFIMKGNTSATLWPANIPFEESPHVLNPQQEFLVAANQRTISGDYPYWIDGPFSEIRALEINKQLRQKKQFDIEDIKLMQNDCHSFLAERVWPAMLRMTDNLDQSFFPAGVDTFDFDAESPTAGLFNIWWHFLMKNIWQDDLSAALWPSSATTMNLILTKPDFILYDVKNTVDKEDLKTLVNLSYNLAIDSLRRIKGAKENKWYQQKNTTINHLAKLAPFSREQLKIGGWGHTINATKTTHGPSWRMVVEMGKDSIVAFGIYPGGQSGNPYSKHYSDRIEDWANGKYYRLLFLPNSKNQNHPRLIQSFTIQPK